MRAYFIRRLLLVIPTLFILSILVFLSVRFIPGDAIDLMADNVAGGGGAIDREALERMLGLDVPVYVQYGRWIGDILLHGTLGESLWGASPVEMEILRRLPVTIQLGLMAIVIALLIALPVGIYTAADYAGRTIAIIGLATPNFWLGIMVMLYPSIWWNWSPAIASDSFLRRPVGESGGVHHSQPDSGHGHVCCHHADDAHHDAGGAQAGLYQDGLVQGSR